MTGVILIFVGLFLSTESWSTPVRELASIQHDDRMDHARELLGKRFKKSAVKATEYHEALEQTIFAMVEKNLPKNYRPQAHEITDAIIVEATKHSLDPFFVMAVISGESSFNPEATGPVGEIGLMQIRPLTGRWMSEITKTKWRGQKSLKDPLTNIRLGTAYLAWLREKFKGHGQLYLAAYNMGPTNVKNALARKVRPKDYPIHVMKRYLAFYKDVQKESL
jgi:soluble lytic murein transglycosylase